MGNSDAHLYLPNRLHSANSFLDVLDGFNKAIEGLWTVKLDQEEGFPSLDGSTPSYLKKMAGEVVDWLLINDPVSSIISLSDHPMSLLSVPLLMFRIHTGCFINIVFDCHQFICDLFRIFIFCIQIGFPADQVIDFSLQLFQRR